MSRKGVRKFFFSKLNVLRWAGYNNLSENAKIIKKIASTYATPSGRTKKNYLPSSFEDCMRHYGLTEEGLAKRMKNAKRASVIYSILGLLLLIYVGFLFHRHLGLSGFSCLILSMLLLTYGFRESFHYFQMNTRQLGGSFKDWAKDLCGRIIKQIVNQKRPS